MNKMALALPNIQATYTANKTSKHGPVAVLSTLRVSYICAISEITARQKLKVLHISDLLTDKSAVS